ncbi:hypothetical protein [Salsipaludibacter albus]|uniref:hypothetical protein n=1 Tax=Salsipaludibacter albus TaxID=2849650 RepID=UPI001EE4202C|nr:hypothetical protein [Salsipaludibacter albus]MBY5163760.1 hypothetical protein [Salsipaludibacter albus]
MTIELLSAMAFDAQTFRDEGLPDPVLKVVGELPGSTRPFDINRVYQAAQGRYEESILILDPDDVVVWQRPWRFIELRGEMFEDLFRDTIRAPIEISSPDEHKLVFLVDGGEVGRIPLYIDASQSALALGVVGDAAEVALKKGSIAWVTIPQPRGGTATRPMWYVQKGRRLFVIKGGGEQELPNLEACDTVDVVVKSKDIKAALGTMRADVRVVDNGSDEFAEIATLGLANRLNNADGIKATERWRTDSTMVELTLHG